MNDNNISGMYIWRCSGGNCLRNGLFPERVKIKPKPICTLTAEGAIQASVVFDGKGNCYVADMSGLVQKFDSSNGSIWKVNLNGSIIATPIVLPNDNYLFVATTAGSVYAIDCSNGNILHKKEIPTKSDPRILSNLLYVEKINSIVLNSWGGKYCCLTADKLDEKFIWDAGIFPYSGAASDNDGNIYSLRAVANRGIECVKVKPDGTETIIYCESERKRGINRMLVSASPVIDEKRKVIYFVINRDVGANLCAISSASDTVLLKARLPNSVQATPVLRSDGAVIVFDLRGLVLSIYSDGELKFQYKTDADYLLSGGVCEQDGTVFFGTPDGTIHQLNENGTGKIIFETARSIQTTPSFSPKGNLYIPSTDKKVYVF